MSPRATGRPDTRPVRSRATQGRTARGRTERAARALFLAAAILLALLAAAAAAPQLLHSPASTLTALTWRPTAIGAAVIAGLLIWGLHGAWMTLAVGIALLELPALLGGGLTLARLADLSQTLLVGLVLGFIGALLLHLSRAADHAADERRTAATGAAMAAGARLARSRAAAVVHDEVLATLRLAAADVSIDQDQLARHAARARLALEGIAEDPDTLTPLAQRLRDETVAVDPSARFMLAADAAPGATPELPALPALPPHALHAVCAALRQTLENSLRHAGTGARRRVEVRVSDGEAPALSVTVIDDGRGFAPDVVANDRLGLRTSVQQAMRDAGGSAEVHSVPGGGARVEIAWPAAGAGAGAGADAATSASLPALSTEAEPAPQADPRFLRVGVTIIAIVFTASQLVLAAVATASADPWWMPLAALALLFAATEVLRFSLTERPGPRRTVAVVALTVAAVGLGSLAAPFAVGELWIASAGAFALFALATRQRIGSALAGGLLIVAVVIASGVAQGAAAPLIVAVAARPLGVAATGALLAASITVLLRRAHASHASAEAEQARAAWEQSARDGLTEQGRETLALVGDTLDTIAAGAPLTPELRAHAQALDGLLRDRIRAGRLAREPLRSAAMRARERGVDVSLLDDRDNELPADIDLAAVLASAASALDHARAQATVRVLPAGRSRAVSIAVDGTPILLE